MTGLNLKRYIAGKWGPKIICGIMWREDELILVLTQEEAWELLSRCLNSTDVDNDVSKVVLKKLARVLQCAQMEQPAGTKAA